MMRATRRFVEDESGMTLAIAMIMIVVIGAMGAGLLAFVERDLFTVVEENRGQRAFEMADTGVQVAKRHLAHHCTDDPDCEVYYDDDPVENRELNGPDNQWAPINGGVTLEDLDDDGDATDWTRVTIDFSHLRNHYVITSEGNYRESKRKIEAIIKGLPPLNSVGSGGGHPIYYTPSAVSIEVDETDPSDVLTLSLNDISMFSEQDILIETISTHQEFAQEYGTGGDKTIKILGQDAEELGDWDSMNARYFDDPKPYNTTPRRTTTVERPGRTNERVVHTPFITPGYASQGKICELTATDTTPGNCESTAQSIADGISSYDSTTGTFAPDGVTQNTNPRPDPVLNRFGTDVAQHCTFMSKPFPTNNQCYITYPFPRPEPPPARLKRTAEELDTQTDRRYWDVATEGDPDWGALFPGCNAPPGWKLPRQIGLCRRGRGGRAPRI